MGVVTTRPSRRRLGARAVAMGKSRARGAASAASGAKPAKGTGFTSGPAKHKTGKTLGGGVEFAKKRLKVGKKVAKHANATDTTIRSKSIRLAAQNIHTVEAKAAVGVSDAEASEKATSKRGTPLAELLNQCGHYAVKTRVDGLNGILEVAEAFPGAIRTRAVDVVERVGERLADGERDARRAARECLKRGIVPALGVDGLAPFAKTLILYAGAALTHVADGVRKDAPAALDALLDAAPELVAAHAPASTLGHLGELLRRGDDGGVGTGSSVRRGVGSQKPVTRLALLKSCRRFLETLVRDESDDARTSSTSSSASTFVWGEVARNGTSTRSIGSMYASRAVRAPASVLAANAAVSQESESTAGSAAGEGRNAVRANAKRIVELAMCVWDDAVQTFSDERGVDVDRLRVMMESMRCARLALKLADDADETEIWDNGGASVASDIIPEIASRTLVAFPSRTPSSVVEKQDLSQAREALVALNFETCHFLLNASSSVASAALVRHLNPSTLDALPHVLARALQYLSSALGGVVLDGGATGESQATPDESYGHILALAREALALPAWCFTAGITGSACSDLIASVSNTWEKAVASQDAVRIEHCIELLATVLPEEARHGYARVPMEIAASWVRCFPRVLWSFKHEKPVASQRVLALLHEVAAQNPPGSPLADVLTACETELGVLFFMVPPVGSPESVKSRPGPFARLPFACQTSAVRLVGVLPTLTQPTIRALTKMCLDVDRVNEELSVIAIETMQTNELAAPLELTVSFYTTLLIGSSGVGFLDKSSKRKDADVEAKAWCIARRVAPRAAAALVALSDADAPWMALSFATAALQQMWTTRVDKGDVDGATRTASGFAALVACATDFAESVSVDDIDDDEIAGAVPKMFAWFVMHAESGKGVDVDVAWRAMRAPSMHRLVPAVARAVADASTSSSDACDRAATFTTALIQSDFIRGLESELKESVRALQLAGERFKSKRAQGLGVAWKVAFGVGLE